MECHAFLCPKRKVAQAATLTIAQAFNLAFKVLLVLMEVVELLLIYLGVADRTGAEEEEDEGRGEVRL